jgi:HEPN domain-containing protein
VGLKMAMNLAHHLLIRSAIDHYATGRYAVFAGLNPTAGNLLHHAVEMCLKGALAKKGKSTADLKELHHELPGIWKEFKAQYPHYLDSFDPTIRGLHQFAEIRYPDQIAAQGMLSEIGRGKRPPLSEPPSYPTKVPSRLYLGEIDELIGKVLAVGSFNPADYASTLSPEARKYLLEENDALKLG